MTAGATTEREARRSGGSVKELVVAGVLVSLIAAGAGTYMGLRLPVRALVVTRTAAPSGEGAHVGSAILDLPPVVTNLQTPNDVWVRLEASMVYDRAKVPQPAAMAGQVAGDFLAYMHTLTLAQIEGPNGLLGVRADLDERAAIRSKGAIKEIVIRTLVVQ